jgi:predicted nucleic acid-binding protein
MTTGTPGTSIPPPGCASSDEATPAGSADRPPVPVLLDTTVLIDALRGRPAAARVLRLRSAGDVPWVCAINVEEIHRGIRPEEQQTVSRLLEALRVAPLGRDEGERAGAWRREYAARGVTLSQADCLIAAAAVSVNATLATGNPRDFPMAEVDVDHWPVGA